MNKIYLIGTGMITAAGSNTKTTAAAVRAGISCYNASSQFNKHRKPIKTAEVPLAALPPLNDKLLNDPELTTRHKHLLRLSDPALKECFSSYEITTPLPIFFAGSEMPRTFFDSLTIQTGISLDKANSRQISTGRAGGMEAIDIVFKYFHATGNDFALVGGVESLMGAQRQLSILDGEDRLLAEGVMNGFAPGEAAGFLLLASESAFTKYNLKNLMSIYQPGFGDEPGHLYSDKPYKGEGLSIAMQQAIMRESSKKIQAVYSSQNGESFWAKEYGVAMIRNSSAFGENSFHVHPAECFGDIGAAFGPILLGLMSVNHAGVGLAYCSSDGSSRAAVCVEK